MTAYVVRRGCHYLKPGRFDKTIDCYELAYGPLDEARFFEGVEDLNAWLEASTNSCARRFWNDPWNKHELVRYSDEVADLVTRLVSR